MRRRDAVIAEQARMLDEQATAIGELQADVVALAAEVRICGGGWVAQRGLLDGPLRR